VYEEWNELVEESPAPLYVNIGRWWDSQDVQRVLTNETNGWNQTTRDLFTGPVSILENTIIVATNERVSSEMVMNALDEIKDWPEVTSSNTLSATADKLYRDARSYSASYGLITDNQLAYLQSEIIWDRTEGGIDNRFDSWLHYEKVLGPRYAEFMKSMPAFPDKKMDVYSNFDWRTPNNPHRHLVSSTPLVEDGFRKLVLSFCSPRIPTEDMRLMEVSFSVDPYNHKISTNGNEDEDMYDAWEPRESFWVYDSPAEGLTHFFVWKSDPTDIPNRHVITVKSSAPAWEYSESFFARRIPLNGSCDY